MNSTVCIRTMFTRTAGSVALLALPVLCRAQESPFLTGANALQTNILAQVSSTYGSGDAHTLVENCANSLILRSSASEGGGTARFASSLIGEHEILRTLHSRSRRPLDLIGVRTHSQQVTVEPAVLPSQIEQLPDLQGYLKLASRPQWLRVQLTPDREATPSFEASHEL